MQYFIDENQVYRKVPAGKTAADMGFDESKAIEIPRFPNDFEYWDGEKFVLDEVKKLEEEENRRLRNLSARERHQEAIQQAKEDLIDDLEIAGIFPKEQIQALKAARKRN